MLHTDEVNFNKAVVTSYRIRREHQAFITQVVTQKGNLHLPTLKYDKAI